MSERFRRWANGDWKLMGQRWDDEAMVWWSDVVMACDASHCNLIHSIMRGNDRHQFNYNPLYNTWQCRCCHSDKVDLWLIVHVDRWADDVIVCGCGCGDGWVTSGKADGIHYDIWCHHHDVMTTTLEIEVMNDILTECIEILDRHGDEYPEYQ